MYTIYAKYPSFANFKTAIFYAPLFLVNKNITLFLIWLRAKCWNDTNNNNSRKYFFFECFLDKFILCATRQKFKLKILAHAALLVSGVKRQILFQFLPWILNSYELSKCISYIIYNRVGWGGKILQKLLRKIIFSRIRTKIFKWHFWKIVFLSKKF